MSCNAGAPAYNDIVIYVHLRSSGHSCFFLTRANHGFGFRVLDIDTVDMQYYCFDAQQQQRSLIVV